LTVSAGPIADPLGPADVLCWSEGALRRLRQVLRPVRPRRRVQPPLLRLGAARAVHEPRVMIDSQCNVHTAICVQYRVGATAAQAGSDKETPISKNTQFYIEAQSFDIVCTTMQISKESELDSEGPFVDIDKFSISGYKDIEVLIFDIDDSSISYCVNIEILAFDIADSSISYWINIECHNLQHRRFLDFRYSISNVKTFDIEISYRTRYQRSFSDIRYRRLLLRYRNIPISKGPTFDIEGRQGSR
jgi:hypothetical protein